MAGSLKGIDQVLQEKHRKAPLCWAAGAHQSDGEQSVHQFAKLERLRRTTAPAPARNQPVNRPAFC